MSESGNGGSRRGGANEARTVPLAQLPTSGRFFEDFEVGQLIRHPLGRTVTSTDNIWFTNLTMNPNPIHFDHVYAAATEWGRPLVNSAFTMALVTGLTVEDLSKNGVNLGWDRVRLPHPVFEGDTLYAESEVISSRASESRPTQGIVGFRTTGFNQEGVTVIEYDRTVLVYRRDAAPRRQVPRRRE
ncbi:MAG: MaoC family dehydratase [Acidobacteria bacterium]|nr:MAG: MaoC family dehydratase [Acidobacteriota bacterium]REK07088.1 MAG: MaoC family dehydratase [Acidobacteriota bacterium]